MRIPILSARLYIDMIARIHRDHYHQSKFAKTGSKFDRTVNNFLPNLVTLAYLPTTLPDSALPAISDRFILFENTFS